MGGTSPSRMPRPARTLTRSVLTQIVLDQEARGPSLLSVDFLKDLIRLHEDEIQAAVPAYLDFSIATLKREQDRLWRQMPAELKGRPGALAAQVRRNIALFEQAVAVVDPCPDDAPPKHRRPVDGRGRPGRARSDQDPARSHAASDRPPVDAKLTRPARPHRIAFSR